MLPVCAAGLSRLLSFNPETDHDQIQRAMFSLTHDFEEAQDEIVDLVQKNKRDFDQRVSGSRPEKDAHWGWEKWVLAML